MMIFERSNYSLYLSKEQMQDLLEVLQTQSLSSRSNITVRTLYTHISDQKRKQDFLHNNIAIIGKDNNVYCSDKLLHCLELKLDDIINGTPNITNYRRGDF